MLNKQGPNKIDWTDSLIKLARENNIAVFIKDNYGYPKRIKEFPKAI